jgi:hypothetical protein
MGGKPFEARGSQNNIFTLPTFTEVLKYILWRAYSEG